MMNISANPLTTTLACSPAATAQRALKMHLHLVRSGRAEYRVLTLRPGIDVQYASNYFHATWHFLTDHIGASVLARLWWALSFDRNPNVLVVIDGAHVVCNPFDDEPRKMLVFCNGDRTFVDDAVLRRVAHERRAGTPSVKTVSLRTHGMALVERAAQVELAGGDKRPWNRRMGRGPYYRDERKLWMREIVEARAGAVVYRAPAEVLRVQALRIAQMSNGARRSISTMIGGRTNHEYLAAGRGLRQPLGEVQIYTGFRDMVSAAARASQSVERTEPTLAQEVARHYWHRVQGQKLQRRSSDRLRKRSPLARFDDGDDWRDFPEG